MLTCSLAAGPIHLLRVLSETGLHKTRNHPGECKGCLAVIVYQILRQCCCIACRYNCETLHFVGVHPSKVRGSYNSAYWTLELLPSAAPNIAIVGLNLALLAHTAVVSERLSVAA